MTDTPGNSNAATGRVQTVDALRGLALLGMVIVHFHDYAQDRGPAFQQIAWSINTFAVDKFYPLFACLFGVGFAIQFQRWSERPGFVWMYLRRLLCLMAFAVVLIALTGYHVLEIYAAWGLVLLIIRKWSNRSLLFLLFAWILIAPVRHFAIAMVEDRRGVTLEDSNARIREEFRDWPQYHAAVAQLEKERRWVDLAKLRLTHSFTEFTHWTGIIISADAFFMFLIGVYAVRRGVFQNPKMFRDLLIVTIVVGIVTLIFYGELIPLPPFDVARKRVQIAYASLLFRILNGQLLGIAYAAAFLLLMAYTSVGARIGRLLGFAGRMSLTNYVAQVVIIEIFLDVWGIHFTIGHLTAFIAAIVVFGLQIVMSRWWMQHFRYGPLEWLWRSATFARWQPMRRS